MKSSPSLRLLSARSPLLTELKDLENLVARDESTGYTVIVEYFDACIRDGI